MLAEILRNLLASAPGVTDVETLVDTPRGASLRVQVGERWYVLSLSRDSADSRGEE
jgi:hypothetical protein